MESEMSRRVTAEEWFLIKFDSPFPLVEFLVTARTENPSEIIP